MALTPDSLLAWSRDVLGFTGWPKLQLADYLRDIPKLDALSDLPRGTPVVIRGDVDAKVGEKIGEGDIRLRSMVETLRYGQSRGWKQVIFGHHGRKGTETLAKIALRLGELLGCPVPLVPGWLDKESNRVTDAAATQVADAAPGSVLMLENVRQYPIETCLWETDDFQLTEETLPGLMPKLATFAQEMATKIGQVYINEALSAGSDDASTLIVPAAMQRVALGSYVRGEFEGPMARCLQSQLVVFSGIKIDKLDDLEAVMSRGYATTIFVAGALAMALKKAEARLAGQEFSLGASEDPANEKKDWYIPASRVEQGARILQTGRAKGIKFVLPIDFVIGDGSVVEKLAPGQAQFDIGPKSSAAFADAVSEFIREHAGKSAVAFHNGVFGKFEEPQFAKGTAAWIPQLKRLKDAGVQVYVGGGEGGTALERYGQPDWVTHVFTAGGTVLNALGSTPVKYLVALRKKAKG